MVILSQTWPKRIWLQRIFRSLVVDPLVWHRRGHNRICICINFGICYTMDDMGELGGVGDVRFLMVVPCSMCINIGIWFDKQLKYLFQDILSCFRWTSQLYQYILNTFNWSFCFRRYSARAGRTLRPLWSTGINLSYICKIPKIMVVSKLVYFWSKVFKSFNTHCTNWLLIFCILNIL